jgi:peroxiredoxin
MTSTENKTETEKSPEPAAKVAPIRARRGVRPRQQAPELTVRLTDGTTWRLADARPRAFTMVVFYRGSHCPGCRAQLSELNRRLDELAERGVDVIAISGDSEEVAAKTVEEWRLDRLQVGYGLDEDTMRRWGLFVSAGHDGEPAQFNEPGLFLTDPDGAVYYEALNSMPWGRPRLDDIVNGIDFVVKANYPARGEA